MVRRWAPLTLRMPYASWSIFHTSYNIYLLSHIHFIPQVPMFSIFTTLFLMNIKESRKENNSESYQPLTNQSDR